MVKLQSLQGMQEVVDSKDRQTGRAHSIKRDFYIILLLLLSIYFIPFFYELPCKPLCALNTILAYSPFGRVVHIGPSFKNSINSN